MGHDLYIVGAGLSGFLGNPVTVVSAIVIIMLFQVLAYASRYRKVGPNEALVISGLRRVQIGPDGKRRAVGYRTVVGGGTFVWPVLEQAQTLSLNTLEIRLAPPSAASRDGAPLVLEAEAHVKIGADGELLENAVERLLGKSADEIRTLAKTVLEERLSEVVAEFAADRILAERGRFSLLLGERAEADLKRQGLVMEFFALREARLKEG